MSLYPAFIDLKDRVCLVAGLGPVGRRKVEGLLAAGPRLIRLVDPAPPSVHEQSLRIEAKAAGVSLERAQRPFAAQDIEGCALVFAATNDGAVNRQIALACKERNILCNVADAPEASGFLAPAVWRQANIQAAVSISGASPALAAHIRDELAIFLDGRYTVLAQLLDYLRPLLLGLSLGAEENKLLFRKLMEAGLPTALQVRDHARAAAILRNLLPAEIHADIEPFLNTLAARPGRVIQ